MYEDQEDSEVCAVLKLDEGGDRLVMVLEPENLVDSAELEALKQVASQSVGGSMHMNNMVDATEEEKQIVTFQIENENYGDLYRKGTRDK